MTVGSVELSVSLSLAQLIKDAQKASDVIKQQIKQPEVKVKVSVEASSIVKLSKTLGGTVGAAQQFSNALGLTSTQAQAAVTRIGQLNSAGATTAEKYKILRSEFGLTATQMYQLGNAAKLVDGNLKAQAATIQNNSKNVAGLANALGTSYGAAQRFAQGLGLTAKEANEAVSKLSQLNQVGATTDQKFQALNQELGLTKSQFDQVNAAGQNLNRGLAGNAQAFQDAVSKSSQYTQALTEVSQQLGQAGAQINQFSTQAAGAAIAFDSATAKVGTLSDNASGIASEMRDLSKELDYQASSTDLLGASYDILSSGFSDVADISGIARASVLGSVGGFSSVGTVADATTTILNAYGDALGENLSISERSAQVVDILAQTQDKGKITIDQYAKGIGRVASIAALSGVSLKELSAAIATATAKGVPAENSISGVRQAIINLTKPTLGAQALLEKFGISNASATLKSEGLIGVLQRLKDAGATGSDLTRIFTDIDGLATIAPIAGENLDDFKKNLDAMDSSAGKAAKSAAVVAASFQGQLTQAFNQANEALISLGNGVKSALVPLLQALTFLVQNFNALPEPIKGAIGVAIVLSGGLLTLAGAVAAVAAVLPSVVAGLKVMGIQGLLAGAGATAAGTGATVGASGMRVMATAAGGLLVKLGLLAVAMSVVQTALSRFDDSGKGFKESAGEIEKSLLDLQLEMGKTKEAAEGILPKDPPPTDFIDGLVTKFNEVNSTINKLTGLPPDFLEVPTNAQKRLEDASLGVSQLQQAMGNAIDTSRSFSGSQEDAAKVSELLSAAITKAKEDLANLSPEKLGTVAYEELSKKIKGTIKELETEQTALVKRTGIAKESSDASVDAGDAIAAAEQKASDAITATTEAYTQRSAELSNADKLREAEIKTAVALGLTTEADGQSQLLEQQRSSGQERLVLAETQSAQLRDLLSSTTDPEKIKELNGKILDADGAIADARLAIAENLASAREAIERKALDRIEKANRESEARITESQQARTLAVKQAQLDGSKTAEEAATAIAAIEQDGIDQTVQAKRDELSEVQSLRQQGVLSAEQSRDRELQLNEEIGGLNLARIDKEIAAQEEASAAALKAVEEQKKAVLDAIDAAGTARTAPLQTAQIQLDISVGANDIQGKLLSAQLEQQKAIAEAVQTRFDVDIQRAKLDGDEVLAAELKLDQLGMQRVAMEAQFKIETLQLKLAQAQRNIELERQKITANIAFIEADIALQKAIANGASEEEILNLQKILGLRQQQVDQVAQSSAAQDQLNAIEQDTLKASQQSRTNQGIADKESQKQQVKDAKKNRDDKGKALVDGAVEDSGGSTKSSSDSSSEGRVLTSRGIQTLSAEESEKQRIASGQRTGFNASGLTTSSVATQLKTKVPSLQIADMGSGLDLSSTIQTGDAAVVAKIDELKVAVMQLANTPRCVSVSAPDPVAAVGQVLSDIGTANFRRAKL